MKRMVLLAIGLSLTLGLLFALAVSAAGVAERTPAPTPAAQSATYAPNQVLVKLRSGLALSEGPAKRPTSGSAPLDALLADEKIKAARPVFAGAAKGTERLVGNGRPADLDQWYLLTLPDGADVARAVAALRANAAVLAAEPNYLVKASQEVTPTVVPDDVYFFQQWGLTQIGAPEAWAMEQGNPGFVLAILDTGIDLDHPDLAGRLWVNPGEIPDNGLDDDSNGFVDDVNGWNFVEDINLPQDDSGHGTHVAGISAANGNNGIGVAGADWGAAIMPVRILNSGGAGTHADAAAALRYAADKGAQVINMSFGAYSDSQLLRDAVGYAAASALLVGAAGNDGSSNLFYPAAYPQVIAVAATGPGDVRTAFSNYGAWVDIAAPGQTIWSTVYDDGYVGWSGASMAAPFVAGAASLVWAHYPDLTLGGLRQHLLNTAADVDTPNPGYIGLLGRGRLDLAAALRTPPHPRLELSSYAVNGVASGRPEPNSTVNLTVTLANGWADASAVTAVLSSANSHVTLSTPDAAFPDIAGNASGVNPGPFVLVLDATTPYNAAIALTLTVEAAGGYSVTLPLTLTTASSLQNVNALTIASDTAWTADRQYVIGGPVRVLPGVTLTVAPDTWVQFQPAGSLTISGTLIADGTAEAPIRFEGAGVTGWGGITFTDASVDAAFDGAGSYLSGSVLRHVRVVSATTGIRLQNAAPLISHSEFNGHSDRGLSIDGSSPVVTDNSFTGNFTALSLANGSTAAIARNRFSSNTSGITGSGAPLVQDNEMRDNGTGLYLNSSGSTTIAGNLFSGNGTGAYLSPGWPTGDRVNPDVAYNQARDEYLVIWQDARVSGSPRIYGQRLSGDGALAGGEIAIATEGSNSGPRLAYDPVGDAFLALWTQPSGAGYALMGQMIASNGILNGSAFSVTTFSGGQNSYALAANAVSGGYAIVWNDLVGGDYDVYAQQIDATGAFSGTRLTVISDAISQMDVTVAHNAKTNEYLIVWAENQGTFSAWDLYGRRLRQNGTFTGIPFTVSAASGDQRHPAAAAETALGWYTVVWDDSRNSRYDIYGRRITNTGALYGNDVQLFAAPAEVLAYGLPHLLFSAATGEHIVFWTESWATGDVVGQRVTASGGLVVQSGKFSLTTEWSHQELGGVAYRSTPGQFLAVWRDQRNSLQSIYGQRCSPDGTLLDNPSTSRDETNPAVNFPIVSGAVFIQNTVVGNSTGVLVSLSDADLLVASNNSLFKNTLNGDYLPEPSGNANFASNYWATTDQAAIAATLRGPFTISPTLTAPDPAAPPVLWRLYFARQGDPTPQEAVEGVSYGPVGAEQLDVTLDFSRPMDTDRIPYVTIGNGSETAYTPTQLIRFGEWISPTRWLGSYMVDWYTGDGTKRVSVESVVDAAGRFTAPTDRRFTFDVSILAASNGQGEGGWNRATLHWNPVNLSTLAGYHIYRGDTTGGPYSRITPSILAETRYTDTAVINSQTYYYVVRVVNTDLSERDYTTEIKVTPGDPTPPTIPVVVDDGVKTNITTTLHATWSAQDPESGIVEYQYCIGTTKGGCQVVSWTSTGTATEVTRTGLHLTNGVTYYFSVKAKNAAGAWNSIVGTSDGIKVDTSLPAVAPVVAVARDDTDLVMTWLHTVGNVSYQVWRSTSPYFTPGAGATKLTELSAPVPGNTLTFTDSGAIGNPASNYFYVVRALNATGAWSDSDRRGGFSFALQPGN